MGLIKSPDNLKINSQKGGESGGLPILSSFYELMYILQKSGLSYDYIQQLTFYECWLFFARECEDLSIDRYLTNIPTDREGKVIKYKSTYYISEE
jgi:hypothetical protein